MSIITKTGDGGETSLLYNRRITKDDKRITAVGAIDELNVAIGAIKVAYKDIEWNRSTKDALTKIQRALISLMGEVSCHPWDSQRYFTSGLLKVSRVDLNFIEAWCARIEPGIELKDWALPGVDEIAQKYDEARVVARRAERAALGLTYYPISRMYLNRLSDLFWLCARAHETPTL